MTPDQTLDAFLTSVVEITGRKPEEVRAFLREKFGAFSKERVAEYSLAAYEHFRKEDMRVKLEADMAKEWSDVPCPICGKRTIGVLDARFKGRLARRFTCESDQRYTEHWWQAEIAERIQGAGICKEY